MEELDPDHSGYVEIVKYEDEEALADEAHYCARVRMLNESRTPVIIRKYLKQKFESVHENWRRIRIATVRLTIISKRVDVIKAVIHSGSVLALYMRKPVGFKYKSGMHIFLKCPDVSPVEWYVQNLWSVDMLVFRVLNTQQRTHTLITGTRFFLLLYQGMIT